MTWSRQTTRKRNKSYEHNVLGRSAVVLQTVRDTQTVAVTCSSTCAFRQAFSRSTYLQHVPLRNYPRRSINERDELNEEIRKSAFFSFFCSHDCKRSATTQPSRHDTPTMLERTARWCAYSTVRLAQNFQKRSHSVYIATAENKPHFSFAMRLALWVRETRFKRSV
jgi:hypothetical protein